MGAKRKHNEQDLGAEREVQHLQSHGDERAIWVPFNSLTRIERHHRSEWRERHGFCYRRHPHRTAGVLETIAAIHPCSLVAVKLHIPAVPLPHAANAGLQSKFLIIGAPVDGLDGTSSR